MKKKLQKFLGPCDCISRLMDVRFGKGQRLHKAWVNADTGEVVGVKCCVCGKKKKAVAKDAPHGTADVVPGKNG